MRDINEEFFQKVKFIRNKNILVSFVLSLAIIAVGNIQDNCGPGMHDMLAISQNNLLLCYIGASKNIGLHAYLEEYAYINVVIALSVVISLLVFLSHTRSFPPFLSQLSTCLSFPPLQFCFYIKVVKQYK